MQRQIELKQPVSINIKIFVFQCNKAGAHKSLKTLRKVRKPSRKVFLFDYHMFRPMLNPLNTLNTGKLDFNRNL